MLNAVQYIEYLKKLQRKSSISINDNIIRPKIDDSIIDSFYLDNIINPLLSFLPDNVYQKCNNIPFAVMPSCKVNASAIKAPNGELFVVLNQKLSSLFSYFMQTRILVVENRVNESLIDTFKVIKKCFDPQTAFDSHLPIYTHLLSDGMKSTATIFTSAMELFVIFHEYAHIFLNHFDSSSFTHQPFLYTNNTLVLVPNNTHQKEFDADIQAIKWILYLKEHYRNNDYANLVLKVPCLMYDVLYIIGIAELSIYEQNSPTHPSAIRRLQNIINECSDILSEDDIIFITEARDSLLDLKNNPIVGINS